MNRTGTLAFVSSSFLFLLTACGTSVLGGGSGGGSERLSGTGGTGSVALDAGPPAVDDGGPPVPLDATAPVTAPPPPPCARTGVDPGAGTPYAHLQYGFAATWSGTAKPPYGWTGPGFPDTLWSVDFTFRPDGHYSGHCLESDCSALYYGSDTDDPGKTYTLDDIQASGKAIGTIQVYFAPNDWNTGDLSEITLSPDLTQLSFWFMKDGYGPVLYDLQCTN